MITLSPLGNGTDKSNLGKNWKSTASKENTNNNEGDGDECTTSIMTSDEDSCSQSLASCSSFEETKISKRREQAVALLMVKDEACKKLDSEELTRIDHQVTDTADIHTSTKSRPRKKVRHVGLVKETLPRQKQSFFLSSKHGISGSSNMNRFSQLRMSESAPALSLAAAVEKKRKLMPPSLSSQANATFSTAETPPGANKTLSMAVVAARKRKNLSPSLSSQANAPFFTTATQSGAPKPHEYLLSLLRQQGLPTKTYAALELNNFFHPVTEESVHAYDHEMAIAVRKDDLETLYAMKSTGRTMQCGNKFGETVIHTACRRGSVAVLRFLLDTGVNPAVCCDAGRTPLHDACWTPEPNFELVSILLAVLPDLLYITDNRSLPPLAYVPARQWSSWREFLDGYQNNNQLKGLQPRHLSG